MSDDQSPNRIDDVSPFRIGEKPSSEFSWCDTVLRRLDTVGLLIKNLKEINDWYESATIDIATASPECKHNCRTHRDFTFSYWRSLLGAAPGMDRVRGYTHAQFGDDITLTTARQLLGDLICRCGLSVAAAEAMTLVSAMDALDRDGANGEREPKAPAITPAGPSGFLGGEALADALGVHPSRRDAFFKRLERERTSLGDDNWQEVANRQANTPRYQYRADSPRLRELANDYKSQKPD